MSSVVTAATPVRASRGCVSQREDVVGTHLFAGLGELADEAGGDLDRAHAADLAIAS